MIVAVTKIKLKKVWDLPFFLRLSIASMQQCKTSEGLLHVETRAINLSTFVTFSTWEQMEDMQRFVYSGAHRNAMKKIAQLEVEVSTTHFKAEHTPSLEDAVLMLEHQTERMPERKGMTW